MADPQLAGAAAAGDEAVDVDDDDALPPEHSAAADAPVSAGEVLSGEGLGMTGAAPAAGRDEPAHPSLPGDGS